MEKRKTLPLALFFLTVQFFLPPSPSSIKAEKILEEGKTIISVVKFEDRSIGTKDYAPWRMGIPDMIMESLGVVPSFKVISREYLITRVLKEQEFQLLGATDPASAVKLGNLLNARYMVVGSFSVFKNTLHINAKVLSVETGELKYQASTRGSLDGFYELQNEIALDLTKGLRLSLNDDTRQKVLSRVDTRVVRASLANYRGEEKVEKITVLESIKKEKDTKQKIKVLKTEAKESFKEAIELDKDYKKAKENLGKLGLGVPMTL